MFSSSPFNPVSPQEQVISHLFIVMLIILTGIFVLVAWLVTYNCIRYRHRKGAPLPPQRTGLKWLEIVWTALPVLLLAVIFVLTVRAMHHSDPDTPQRTPDIVLIGHQWWWEVRYPHAGVTTANEIHLPVGQAQLVEFRSADVIHDFWVPQLGRKMDMIPGHPNRMWLDVTQTGTYLGVCDEFCGAQHAWMRLRVLAQPPDHFRNWLRQQQTVPAQPTGNMAEQGRHIYQQYTCGNCHAIRGTPQNQVQVAPDLTHVASRETLGAGVLNNSPQNLAKWMRNPQAIKPACYMPDFHLNGQQVQELVAYLETLR